MRRLRQVVLALFAFIGVSAVALPVLAGPWFHSAAAEKFLEAIYLLVSGVSGTTGRFLVGGNGTVTSTGNAVYNSATGISTFTEVDTPCTPGSDTCSIQIPKNTGGTHCYMPDHVLPSGSCNTCYIGTCLYAECSGDAGPRQLACQASTTTVSTSSTSSTSSSTSTTNTTPTTTSSSTTSTSSTSTTSTTIVSALYDNEGNAVDYWGFNPGELSSINISFHDQQFVKGTGSSVAVRLARLCLAKDGAALSGHIHLEAYADKTSGCLSGRTHCPDTSAQLGGASTSLDLSTIVSTRSSNGPCDFTTTTGTVGNYYDFTWTSKPTSSTDFWIVVVSDDTFSSRVIVRVTGDAAYPPGCTSECNTYTYWQSSGTPPSNVVNQSSDWIMVLYQ